MKIVSEGPRKQGRDRRVGSDCDFPAEASGEQKVTFWKLSCSTQLCLPIYLPPLCPSLEEENKYLQERLKEVAGRDPGQPPAALLSVPKEKKTLFGTRAS